MLRSVGPLLVTDVSGNPSSPTFKSQSVSLRRPLKMRPIRCPETSVWNYQPRVRNIPEERIAESMSCYGRNDDRSVQITKWKHSLFSPVPLAVQQPVCCSVRTEQHTCRCQGPSCDGTLRNPRVPAGVQQTTEVSLTYDKLQQPSAV